MTKYLVSDTVITQGNNTSTGNAAPVDGGGRPQEGPQAPGLGSVGPGGGPQAPGGRGGAPRQLYEVPGGGGGGVGGGVDNNNAAVGAGVRPRNQGGNPLLNVRDRLFHALFYRIALAYARAIPRPVRRFLEFAILLKVRPKGPFKQLYILSQTCFKSLVFLLSSCNFAAVFQFGSKHILPQNNRC